MGMALGIASVMSAGATQVDDARGEVGSAQLKDRGLVSRDGTPSESGCGLLTFREGARLPLVGAVGDSITTYIALNQPNVVESNGLINTSPVGLLGLFVIKAGIVRYADGQPDEIRAPVLKMAAGAWSGISVSNLIIAAGATTPIGLVVGLAAGTAAYLYEDKVLQAEAAEPAPVCP